jgi:hypothetical protein
MRRHYRSRQVIENEGKRKPRFRLSDENNAREGIFRDPLKPSWLSPSQGVRRCGEDVALALLQSLKKFSFSLSDKNIMTQVKQARFCYQEIRFPAVLWWCQIS